MFLLLLIGLGAAGVKAQVRIGGNGVPNAAAVLDLNADDTNSGTKGLALPRVSLTNVSTPLTGTPVVNGMMVYNTSASTTGGSGVGIYYWDGSSSKWVKVINSDFTVPLNKIQTSVSDSGLFLMSTGSGWTARSPGVSPTFTSSGSLPLLWRNQPVTFSIIIDTSLSMTVPVGRFIRLVVPGLGQRDFCVPVAGNGCVFLPSQNTLDISYLGELSAPTPTTLTFRCYRPSL